MNQYKQLIAYKKKVQTANIRLEHSLSIIVIIILIKFLYEKEKWPKG
jgi:hypothetical protein